VTRDAFCEAVWPDSDSLSLDRTFRVTLTLLRKAMAGGAGAAGAGAGTRAGPRLIVFKNDLYRLDIGAVWCDVCDFDRLIKQGSAGEREGDATAAAALRRRAFDLYRGEFLADFDEIWIEPRRERLRSRFLGVGRALCETALASKNYEEAQDIAERLVSCDPLAEEGHRLLIRVHQACGRRDAAGRQLERCRAILGEALGLDVSADTVALLHPARKGSSA
jgi:DNA-binding SARP family transcriptional activator